MYPHLEFGSHVEIYDATHTWRGYENMYCLHNWCILGEQVRLTEEVKERKDRRGAWGIHYGMVRGWGQTSALHTGRVVHGLTFPMAPKERTLGFLISLFRCGAEEKRDGRSWKAVSCQTSENGVRLLISGLKEYYISNIVSNRLEKKYIYMGGKGVEKIEEM